MLTIDYYHSLNSPWSYLGHQRFSDMVKTHGVHARIHPVDFAGVIFPPTGGLPVPQRPPARQAYRLQELERWRSYLNVPLNLHPAHWPADERFAAAIEIAIRDSGADAMAFAGAVMRAVWAEDKDIADESTVLAIARSVGIDAEPLSSQIDQSLETRQHESEQALARQVFGAPSYVIGDQVFWGQDRLDFVARALENAGSQP